MAITHYAFITACLFVSQMEHCCLSRELLPDYVEQVMERLVNPTLLTIFKLKQIKRLANEQSLANNKDNKENEYCDILHGELALEGSYLERAYDINGKLVGYMTLFTMESDKCAKESFALNKLSCFLKVGKTVAYVYGLYEKSAKHALNQMETIDKYVARLVERCFQDSTDIFGLN
uniref:Putative secreted protein n=1 Tax=Panstrongylus lignarius TaxID=156445 RepID=A0A224XY67_9HEMI